MTDAVSKLTCGFCGSINPRFGPGNSSPWTPYYRAVYCTGPSGDDPRLSGLGFHQHDVALNLVPPESHQRFDDPDLNQLSLVAIQVINPPAPELSDTEKALYSWGFLFHDSCWRLLEQAAAPGKVDVKALWRILLSVPCAYDLPNWGHNYGGLYLGVTKDLSRGEHFVLLGANSNLIIPSTYSDPFKVPEMESILARCRIQPDDGYKNGNSGDPPIYADSILAGHDPFSTFPLEIKEMLLTHLASEDVPELRLASREIAAVPLTQSFFQSRFWPDREFEAMFDGFLLSPAERRGTDWEAVYREMKTRQRLNRVCLGERNRFRIWKQTVKPLVKAMDRLAKLSELRGGPDWKWRLKDGGEADWKFVKTSRSTDPETFGEVRRTVYRAEVELPSAGLRAVNVSFIEFFGVRYVTGLRFSFAESGDVEIGYISRNSEETLKPEADLLGFYAAVNECGFRALALYTGHHMLSEYLSWAGNVGTLPHVPVKTNGNPVRRIRAAFDGFRLQALLIPDS